jgi:RHS repeat-associated protein
VDLPDGRLIEYVIDGQNRRIGKKIDGVLTKAWLYKDQLKPIAELDGVGNLTARFVYGSKSNVPDVVTRYAGGVVTTYRVISDHLGSPIMAVNVNNAADVPFKAEYGAFGERNLTSAPSSADRVPFGFAGGMYDADTGLTRFGARDCDAQIGRWVSKEPLRFVAGKNLYVYAWNDPIDLTDPSGLAPTDGGGGTTGTGCGGAEGNSSTGDPIPQPSAGSYAKNWCGSPGNENLVPDSILGVDWSATDVHLRAS